MFGFASSPEIPLAQRNLGFLDQRFGLKWVQDNIAAFGGSPDKITVFGESAGAISTDALVTSYGTDTKPPFRAAILQSGQVSYGLIHDLYTKTDSTPAWNNMSKLLGCPGKYSSDLACIRAASAQDIKKTIETNVLTFYPTADNVTLVSDGAARRMAGNVAEVPILMGTNAEEGRVFVVGQSNTTEFIETSFGAAATPKLVKAIEDAYAIGTGNLETPYDQIAQIYTELLFQCPQGLYVNESAKFGVPVWRYYFNSTFSNTQGFPGLGAYHSSEIPIVFSTYPSENVTTQEFALSTAMRGAWVRFAKNPIGGPGWNAVKTGTEGSVLLGPTATAAGGILSDSNGMLTKGAWNLGVWGNRLDAAGSGITVIDQYEVDYRCALFHPLVTGGEPV